MKKYIILVLIFLVSCKSANMSSVEKINFDKSSYEVSFNQKNYDKKIILEGQKIAEYRFFLKDSSVVFFSITNSGSELINDFLSPKDFILLLDEVNLEKEFTNKGKSYLLLKRDELVFGFANLDTVKSKEMKALLENNVKRLSKNR
ncbi:hypothetical protein [Flavobacterium lacisediminis]|uniref:Lipoprotein n=1 Tax=Flavobacterium lacisediminis TaxID=2989705 RepID=A0ABT3EDH9_9FLAO|nr:hypothetical protein [Flavobacterium lacisediminis]MCW1146631.1 hypothetical protein [Flavobacterium lacisediminis]